MFFRSKRLSAFLTGCLMSLVAFAYPSQLLAQTNTLTDPIQGVTSTTQAPPSNDAEIADAIAGINAGLAPIDVGSFGPDPIREHAVFLSDLWNLHFQTGFIYNSSGLTFDSWIPNGTGSLQGYSESGSTFTANILFSLNAPLDDRIGLTNEDLVILESANASFGAAWLELSTPTASTKIFGIWMEMTDVENVTQATFVPITTISDEDWDNLSFALPSLLEDIEFIWDDLMYPAGAWSNFKSKMRTAVKTAVAVIAVAAVVVVTGVVASAIAGLAGITMSVLMIAAIRAVVGVTATSVIAAQQLAEVTDENIQALRDQLQEELDNLPDGIGDNIDLDSMTDEEFLELIRELH